MIPHVLLADSIIIQLPTGPITRTKEQFHFNRIVQIAKSGTIDELTPLLAPIDCPNGVYHLYIGTTLFVTHTIKNLSGITNCNYVLNAGKFVEEDMFVRYAEQYIGTYQSLQAIQDDYPEYFI